MKMILADNDGNVLKEEDCLTAEFTTDMGWDVFTVPNISFPEETAEIRIPVPDWFPED